MRGHPGVEIGAAAEASGARLVVVTPAFPATGRTVEDGRLSVHGLPLSETEVGRDPLSPVATSLVSDVLRQHCRLPLRTCPLRDIRSGRVRDMLAASMGTASMGGAAADGPSLLLCDATSDGDLDRLVAAALRSESPDASVLFAGSAGLASALARASWRTGDVAAATPIAEPPILVVTASQTGPGGPSDRAARRAALGRRPPAVLPDRRGRGGDLSRASIGGR